MDPLKVVGQMTPAGIAAVCDAVREAARGLPEAQAQRAMQGKWAKPDRQPGIKVTPWTSARLPIGEDCIQSPEHKKQLG